MRKLLITALTAGLVLFGAASSQAGTLTSATFDGAFLVTTSGGSLTASGTSTGSSSANVQLTVATQFGSMSQPGPPAVLFATTLGGTQALNFSGGAATINQGIAGGVHVDIGGLPHGYGHLFTIPLSAGASANGASAITTTASNVLAGQITLTVSFFGWQTGPFTYQSTSSNNVTGTFSAAGSNGLTANGGGTLVLIAPSVVIQTVGGAKSSSASATTLTLNFQGTATPEPGTLALLGAGVVGLLAVGRRRA